MNDNTDEERLKRTLYRYMSQELAEELLKRDDGTLGGERQEASILFSDIRGATTLTECLEVEEVVGLGSEPISEQKQEVIEAYHKGREYYLKGQFHRAMSEFGYILEELDKNDKAATLHLKRCQQFLQDPPPYDWDGVWTITQQ